MALGVAAVVGPNGLERLPRGRPLLLVANHVNALVDPLLVLGTLPVRARFLAKHSLWRAPVLGVATVWYLAHAVNHLIDIGESDRMTLKFVKPK